MRHTSHRSRSATSFGRSRSLRSKHERARGAIYGPVTGTPSEGGRLGGLGGLGAIGLRRRPPPSFVLLAPTTWYSSSSSSIIGAGCISRASTTVLWPRKTKPVLLREGGGGAACSGTHHTNDPPSAYRAPSMWVALTAETESKTSCTSRQQRRRSARAIAGGSGHPA